MSKKKGMSYYWIQVLVQAGGWQELGWYGLNLHRGLSHWFWRIVVSIRSEPLEATDELIRLTIGSISTARLKAVRSYPPKSGSGRT